MQKKEENPFEILQLPLDATEEEVKKAYRKLSFKLHPDRNRSPAANEQMSLLNWAYEKALFDIHERSSFDAPYQMLKLIIDRQNSPLVAKLKALDLIKKKGDFNRIYSIASYRAPLFHLACLMGRYELAEILVLSQVNLNLTDNRGKTGWDVLFQDRGLGKQKTILDDVLETALKIYTPNAIDQNSGQNLFMKLIENNWQRIAEEQLKSGKVLVAYRNPFTGKSALELALEKGWMGMVFQLFGKGAVLRDGDNTLKNINLLLNFLMKRSYLTKGEAEAASYLIEHKIGLQEKDSEGRTPLDNAKLSKKIAYYTQIKKKIGFPDDQAEVSNSTQNLYNLSTQIDPNEIYISVSNKER